MTVLPRIKKRLLRLFWVTLAVFSLLILTFPFTGPVLFEWLTHSMIATQSQRGYTVNLVNADNFGDGFITTFFDDQSKLRKIVSFGEENGAHYLPNTRAFWSKDGTLFILQDKVNPSFLVFDCSKKIAYGTRKGRLLLKQHGGVGSIIFDGHQDFAKKSRYLWPWELRRVSVSKGTSVQHDSEGTNEW